jgi:hypothetical protein
MTSQTISSQSSTRESSESPASRSRSAIISDDSSLIKVMKAYQADQQVKYLHLQAEIEVLLQQLQTLKQQKLRQTNRDDRN